MKIALVLSILVILSVGIAGCTSNSTNNGAQISQAHAYADAYVNSTKEIIPNAQYEVNIVDNGTDAVRLSMTIMNNTTNGGSSTTSTEALNVKQFATKDDATAFFNNVSFGYMANDSLASAKPGTDAYFITTGHNATTQRGAMQINSLTLVTTSVSVAIQQNEFVIYGTVSTMSAGSSSSPPTLTESQTTVGDNTTYSSSVGFNITYPKTFTIDSSTNASSPVKVYIYLNPSSKIDGVNVATYSLASGEKLNDFIDFNLNALQSNSSLGFYKDFTILNETNLTFAGQPAHQITFQGMIPQQVSATNTTDVSVKETQIWLVNNNTGYVVTYKAAQSDYDTYLLEAESIINSFALT